MDAITQKTPCGRIPDTPLANPRHEALAHAVVQGKKGREAGLIAGYKDGPGLKGNIARLRQTPILCERIAEIAKRSADLAEIYDGWVLSDAALFARGTLASFFRRDEEGRIVLDHNGCPSVDFSKATEDELRTLSELSFDKHGRPKIKIHDPKGYLELLARHRGLLRDKLALTDPSGTNPAYYVLADRPMTEAEWEAQRAAPQGQ